MTETGRVKDYPIRSRKNSGEVAVAPEYEFKSKEEDLARVLKRHFAHVLVFENISSDQFEQRHYLYFYASDGRLPFDLDSAKHGAALRSFAGTGRGMNE